MTWDVVVHDEAEPVLERAGAWLAARPLTSTVVATALAGSLGVPAPEHPRWWLLVLEDGEVRGVVMRTAPFAPYPIYALEIPEAAVPLVAAWCRGSGQVAPVVNGVLPTSRLLARALAPAGVEPTPVERLALLRLGEPRPPAPPPGGLRAAGVDDLEVLVPLLCRFHAEADAQAGRPASASHGAGGELTPAQVASLVVADRVRVWESEGRIVHVTCFNPPALGVARIGPVLTPPEHRGRGYAAASVAAVAVELAGRAAGVEVCLFADVENPTSTALYRRIGFEPVAELGAWGWEA